MLKFFRSFKYQVFFINSSSSSEEVINACSNASYLILPLTESIKASPGVICYSLCFRAKDCSGALILFDCSEAASSSFLCRSFAVSVGCVGCPPGAVIFLMSCVLWHGESSSWRLLP